MTRLWWYKRLMLQLQAQRFSCTFWFIYIHGAFVSRLLYQCFEHFEVTYRKLTTELPSHHFHSERQRNPDDTQRCSARCWLSPLKLYITLHFLILEPSLPSGLCLSQSEHVLGAIAKHCHFAPSFVWHLSYGIVSPLKYGQSQLCQPFGKLWKPGSSPSIGIKLLMGELWQECVLFNRGSQWLMWLGQQSKDH